MRVKKKKFWIILEIIIVEVWFWFELMFLDLGIVFFGFRESVFCR